MKRGKTVKQKAKQLLGFLLVLMMVFSNITPAMAATTEVACSECGDHDGHDHADEQGGHQEDEQAGCSDESCGHKHDENVVINNTSTSSISKSLAQKQAACNHTWTTVTTKQPTCGTAGTYVTKCSKCGAGSQNGNGSIPATGKHNWSLTSTTNATCTANGSKKYTCTVCKQTKTETITKLGHNFKQVTTKQPTCGASGTYVTKCSRCGIGSQNGNGTIPATGKHTWDRTAATCTAAKKCTVCGTVGEAAKGHTWNVSAATCTTDKKCTVCGTVNAKATGHSWNVSTATCTTDKKCSKCGTIGQKALGHDYKQVTTKEPTCGASGTYVTKCSRCGNGSQNGNGTIPATGKHTWDRTAATCTAAKKCTVCGTVGEAAKGHTWNVSAATCTTDKKCTVCGTVNAKATGHSWNITAATCTTDKKCTKCGAVNQKALGHDYKQTTTKEPTCGEQGTYVTKCTRCGAGSQNGNGYIPATDNHKWVYTSTTNATCTADGYKLYTCSVCAKTKKETITKLGHDYKQETTKEPTCGTSGTYVTKCSRCGIGSQNGNGTIPATGKHTWDRTAATCTAAKKCTVCGTVGEAAKGHTWNVSTATCTTDKKCTVCGTVGEKATGHNWNISAATCTTDKKCTKCGTVNQKALGHDYKQETTKKPTCGASGTYVTKCSRCGIGSQNGNGTIPATGKHTWNRDEANCIEAKECTECGTVAEKAKGHLYIWETSVKPTIDEAGEQVQVCSVCGATGATRELFRVTYFGNEGVMNSGETSIWNSFSPGGTVTIAPNYFSREGYTFNGWSLDPNAEKGEYAVGQPQVAFDGNTKLYAIWKKDTSYTICYFYHNEYYYQYGDVKKDVTLKDYMFSAAIPLGKEFVGWSPNKEATYMRYAPNETCKPLTSEPGKTILLYPIFVDVHYTIKFMFANYPKSELHVIGDRVAFDRPDGLYTYSCENGYGIYGWAYQEGASKPDFVCGVEYDSLSFTKDECIELYPVYKRVYRVTFFNEGCEFTEEMKRYYNSKTEVNFIDEPFLFPSEACVDPSWAMDGYKMAGWSTQPFDKDRTNSQKLYQFGPSSVVNVDSLDLTTFKTEYGNTWLFFYPLWIENNKELKISAGGGIREEVITPVSARFGLGEDWRRADKRTVVHEVKHHVDVFLTPEQVATFLERYLFSYRIDLDPEIKLTWQDVFSNSTDAISTCVDVLSLFIDEGNTSKLAKACGFIGSPGVGIALFAINKMIAAEKGPDGVRNDMMERLIKGFSDLGYYRYYYGEEGGIFAPPANELGPVHFELEFTYTFEKECRHREVFLHPEQDCECETMTPSYYKLTKVDVMKVETYDGSAMEVKNKYGNGCNRHWITGDDFTNQCSGKFYDLLNYDE